MEKGIARGLALLAIMVIFAPAGTLRVVTINVWSGINYRGSIKMGEYEEESVRNRRTEVLTRQLKELDPDVIALNEANKLPTYARRLSRDLGYDYTYHVGVGGVRAGCIGLPTNLREGDVLMAKKELKLDQPKRLKLSGGCVGNFFTFHFSDATQIIGARIKAAGREIYVFNTHWHASTFPTEHYQSYLAAQRDSGRIDQTTYDRLSAEVTDGIRWRIDEARKTVAFITRVAGNNLAIVTGDLNALADAEEIARLKQAGFVDAFEKAGAHGGYTYDDSLNTNIRLQNRVEPARQHQWPRRKRIDYIFVRGLDFDIADARVVFDRAVDGLYASDHFGVLADIVIR